MALRGGKLFQALGKPIKIKIASTTWINGNHLNTAIQERLVGCISFGVKRLDENISFLKLKEYSQSSKKNASFKRDFDGI